MNKKTILLIAVPVVAVLVVVGMMIFKGEEAEAPAAEIGTADTQTGSDMNEADSDQAEKKEETATIVFTSDGFSPAILTVEKGTVVTVKNDSSTSVQFSSDDHPTHTINQGMNLPVLAAGLSATFTADKVGSWGFHDHIDDSKTGTLVVTEK